MTTATTATPTGLKVLLGGLILWNFIVALDSTALSVALPTISHDLGASATQAFWAGTAYVLCSAALQPLISSMSEAVGRKFMLLLSLTAFTAGAITCGVAHHTSVLLLGRSLQGSGGGGLVALSYIMMADEFTLATRHTAIAALSIAWLVGTVAGPIVSGAFTEHVTWRWVFWINLPFCAIAYVIVIFFLKSTYNPEGSKLQRLKRIDWIGSTMFVASLTSFLIAISWGGTMYHWASWHTAVPLAVGIGGLLMWIVYSIYFTQNPMIPLHIMGNRTAAINYLGNLIQGLAQFAMLFYLPIYYQAVQGYSPMISGVALLPQCGVAGIFSAVIGRLIAKYNTIKPLTIIGWSIYALGLGLLVLLGPHTSIPAWIFINIPSGIGLGWLFSSLALATSAAAETSGTHSATEVLRIKGMASCLNPFFRTIGQSLGIVIAQAAFTNELKKQVGVKVAQDAASLGQIISMLPVGSEERTVLVSAFSVSLHVVWWIMLALALFMLFVTVVLTKDIGVHLPPAPTDTAIPEMESFDNKLTPRSSSGSMVEGQSETVSKTSLFPVVISTDSVV